MRNSLHAVGSALDTAWLLIRAVVSTSVAHWALSAFSVAAAFGLWFAVQDVENPRTEGLVPVEPERAIEVEITNLPDGIVVGSLGRVRVTVEAREEDLDNLHHADFKATVDLSGLVARETVNVPVDVTTDRSGVLILGVLPETVELTATEVVKEDFRVTLEVEGELPEGFEENGASAIQPTLVVVSGDEDALGFVHRVEAVIDISGLKDTATFQNIALTPLTASGSPVTTVSLSVDTVTVTYPVRSVLATKTVPVVIVHQGPPANGYTVTDVQPSDQLVTIFGKEAVIESVESVRTVAINIVGAKSDVSGRVGLDFPEGVNSEDSDVSVTITIVAVESTALLTVAPTFVDLPEGLQLGPGAYSVTVHVRGPVELVSALSPDALEVIVSLGNLGEGVQVLTPEVQQPPDGLEVDPPGTIRVTLVAAAAEEPSP